MRSSVNGPVLLLGALACIAAVALEAVAIAQPILFMDDFQILAKSWTWESTWTHIWLPQNEHIMPLGRVSTWTMIAASHLTWLPLLTALHGPAALVLGMVLVYLFVRRELGQPLYGLVAMTLFGVTAVYQQAVYWFAASFSILALDMVLLGLLAAQRWRQTGNGWQLALSGLWCALAPGWFASGILGGLFCSLYLLPGKEDKETRRQGDQEAKTRHHWARHLVSAGVPLSGTVLFLAVLFGLLQPIVEHIRHLEHYGAKKAEQAFHPLIGAEYTARSVVDNLLPGVVGFWGVLCPVAGVVWLVPFLLAVAALWTWYAPNRRLCLLGLSLICISYWFVYSARAEWSYAGLMNAPHWSRYHLLPQLGLTLLVCAGLPRWSWLFRGDENGRLSRRQMAATVLLIGGCLLVQLPHSIAGQWGSSSADKGLLEGMRAGWASREEWVDEQQAVLRQIEEMDARCRLHRIARETARAALPRLEVPFCYGRESGWEFLWGSPQPRLMSVEEARRLLTGDEASGGRQSPE